MLLIVIFILVYRKGLIYSPLSLYVLIWMLGFCVLPGGELFLQHKISTQFYVAYFVNNLLLLGLILLFYPLSVQNNTSQTPPKLSSIFVFSVKVFIWCTFIYILFYGWEILSKYYDLWRHHPTTLRAMYFVEDRIKIVSNIQHIQIFIYVVTLLSCIVIYFGDKKNSKSYIFKMPIFLSLLFSTFFLGRLVFMRVCIVYAFVYIVKNNYKLRKVILRVLLPIAGVLIIATIMMQRVNSGSKDKMAGAISAMSTYASGSIVAFDIHTQDKTNKYFHGALSLYPFYLQISKFVHGETIDFYSQCKFVKSINTYTIFRPFFDDFKWVGFFFFSFLFHLSIVYASFLKKYRNSIYAFVFYFMLYPVALFSVQAFLLHETNYMYAFFITIIFIFIFNGIKYKGNNRSNHIEEDTTRDITPKIETF